MQKEFNISGIKIKGPILAPMAAVNCTAFRVLCKRYGAALAYTQMIEPERVIADPDILNIVKEEKPVTAQLIGSCPEKMSQAAKALEEKADIIDINLGCIEGPMLGKKCGCYLMKHPEKIEKIVSLVISATKTPVTAKIRSGWDNDNINAIEVSKILENCNVSAIAVHPRTRKQGYRGKADWDIIKKVKDAVNIPIIGNGDIVSYKHAKLMMEKTGCDGIMVGRAAIGNPLIFNEISYHLYNNKRITKTRHECFTDFYILYKKFGRIRFTELKDHAMWFTKNLKNASCIKQQLLKAKDEDMILDIMKNI